MRQYVAFLLLFLSTAASRDNESDSSKAEAFLAFFRPQFSPEKATPAFTPSLSYTERNIHRRRIVRREDRSSNATQQTSAMTPPKAATPIQLTDILNYPELEAGLSRLTEAEKLKKCRLQSYMPEFIFRLHSCALCYLFLRDVPGIFSHPSRKWKTKPTLIRLQEDRYVVNYLYSDNTTENRSIAVFANSSDTSSPILQSFANNQARQKWVDCCEAAEDCCQKMSANPPSNVTSAELDVGFCPATWDGWQCYEKTPPGTTVHAPCPHYIYTILQVEPTTSSSSCAQTSARSCQSNGTWYRNSKHSEWTNYTSCASGFVQDQKQRTYVHVAAYGLSIIATIPALVIFFSYKQLRVARIMLHQNLLISMLLNGFFVIAFKTIVMWNEYVTDSAPTSIINQNGVGCRLLFMLTKYSRMTNYMWMFCEGYYLHKLIASAFAEQKSLIIFYVIGWVFPIIPTVIYAILRVFYANDRCWVVPQESFEWFLNGPSLLSLLINMLFLINIIRVLVTKLRATHANEPSQYRKAVRATLVLFPLFGLHFGITIYRPKSTCKWMEIYLLVNDVLDGFQGFIVALIFCYLNGEVLQLLKRTYTRWNEQRSTGGCMGGSNPSAYRMQSRASRGGSMLGRSVETTQCYSSVPVSPEICCKLNRLSFSTGDKEKKTQPTPSPDRKNGVGHGNGILKPPSGSPGGGSLNHLNSVVKIKNSDSGTFTEIKLNAESSPMSTGTTESVFEMKPQKVSGSGLSPGSNGIHGEHQL